MYRKKLSLLHWRWVGGKYGDKYSILCFNSTDWFCLYWAEPQESVQCRRVQMWAKVTPLSPCLNPAVDSPATRFITFLFTRFYSQTKLPLIQSLLSQYAPLSLRPLTCEVKAGHRWGPREQGCIQFQRARVKRGFLLGRVHSWWSSSRHCPLYYHEKIVRCYNVTLTSTVYPRRDRDASSWTRRWPPLLLQRRQSQGAHPIGWLCFIALTRAQSEDSQGSRPRLVYQLQRSYEFTALVFLYQ